MENESKVTVTYQQLTNFRNYARIYLGQKIERTKLHYALEKMLKETERFHQEFADAEQEVRIELASVDKEGNLLTDKDTGYSYTKVNAKELTKEVRKLGSKEAQINPHYAKELPSKLEPSWYEYFVPFVIEDKEL